MDYLDMYAGLLLAVICGRLFFRIGDEEYDTGSITAALSMLFSAVAILHLHGGVKMVAGLQCGLYVGLWIYNIATSHVTPIRPPKVKLTKAEQKAKAIADKKAKAERKAKEKAAKEQAKAAKAAK